MRKKELPTIIAWDNIKSLNLPNGQTVWQMCGEIEGYEPAYQPSLSQLAIIETKLQRYFKKKLEYFPNIVRFDKNTIKQVRLSNHLTDDLINELLAKGVLPKESLIPNETYIGKCRNASEAVWNGEKFCYQRTKFGNTFLETINHFQDDNGFDLFLPIAIKE